MKTSKKGNAPAAPKAATSSFTWPDTTMTDRERARRINRILSLLRTAREQLGELDATVNTDDFKYFSARLDEIVGNDEEGLTYLATVYGKR